jgi:hypothetical protein
MEPIDKYLKTMEFHAEHSTITCEKLPMNLTIHIFRRMKGLYPHKWASAFKTKEEMKIGMAAWEICLAGLDISDIERGFAKWDKEWPPSAPEFLKACQKEPVLAASRKYTALPKPEPDPDIAKEHFKKMKDKLRGR